VVKLVLPEPETVSLQTWMQAQADTTFFSSQLLRIELLRVVLRTAPERLDRARDVLRGFSLLKIDDTIVEAAESLNPPILRSLDAIHLATAHTLRQHVTAFVAYDVRLLEAAATLGLKVMSPGQDQPQSE
jgi:predicted nucleic acid-binding protein